MQKNVLTQIRVNMTMNQPVAKRFQNGIYRKVGRKYKFWAM